MDASPVLFSTTPDAVRIAYSVTGEGPPLVKAASWLTHLEYDLESPVWRHLITSLVPDYRFVRYDARGSGLSDRHPEELSLEAWVRDLETVVDELKLDRFLLLGVSQGGAVAVSYAARHPQRVSHLILFGAYARGASERGPEQRAAVDALTTLAEQGWGHPESAFSRTFSTRLAPGGTPDQQRWLTDLQRVSTDAASAARYMRAMGAINVVDLLPQIEMPTLVLHARQEQQVPFEEGRILAAGIAGARLVPLDSLNHLLLEDEPAWSRLRDEVRAFIGAPPFDSVFASPSDSSRAHARRPEGGLQTVLFTDLEGSTAMQSRLGDEAAREILRAHDAAVRTAIEEFAGREVKHTGDGLMAAFSSAAGAVNCALAVRQTIERYNAAHADEELLVRFGLNAGEPIAENDDLFGLSVTLAARIGDWGEPGQVLVTDVVRQLLLGKGFSFASLGAADLKGFNDPVPVYEARNTPITT